MLQNTRSVEISFLWLHGSVPLALGLLVAAVGSAIAVMVIGTVRITQLRHRQHRQRATIQPHNEIQPHDDLGLDSHRTEGL